MIHEPAEMCIEAAVQLSNFRDRENMETYRIVPPAAKKLNVNPIAKVVTVLTKTTAEHTPSKRTKGLLYLLN